MAEEKLFISSGELKIEGLLENQPGDKGVVVTHPHPQYGGDMHNNVMDAVCHAYYEKGYSTLRFNFRGVGQSQGSYDNGVGEQEDVKAALRYLKDLCKKEIDLAGYSFGAWVNALGLDKYDQVNRVIMVSPPVCFMDMSFLKYSPKIGLVISGADDDIAGVKEIEEMLPVWNPEAVFRVILDCDHFYGGKTEELKSIICEFLDAEAL